MWSMHFTHEWEKPVKEILDYFKLEDVTNGCGGKNLRFNKMCDCGIKCLIKRENMLESASCFVITFAWR